MFYYIHNSRVTVTYIIHTNYKTIELKMIQVILFGTLEIFVLEDFFKENKFMNKS